MPSTNASGRCIFSLVIKRQVFSSIQNYTISLSKIEAEKCERTRMRKRGSWQPEHDEQVIDCATHCFDVIYFNPQPLHSWEKSPSVTSYTITRIQGWNYKWPKLLLTHIHGSTCTHPSPRISFFFSNSPQPLPSYQNTVSHIEYKLHVFFPPWLSHSFALIPQLSSNDFCINWSRYNRWIQNFLNNIVPHFLYFFFERQGLRKLKKRSCFEDNSWRLLTRSA